MLCISGCSGHKSALRACSGRKHEGQRNIPARLDKTAMKKAGITLKRGVYGLALGGEISCFTTTDNKTDCVGNNQFKQLDFMPDPYEAGGWHMIAAGAYHLCGIMMDMTMHCWGKWSVERLALPYWEDPIYQEDPIRWEYVSCGNTHCCRGSTMERSGTGCSS